MPKIKFDTSVLAVTNETTREEMLEKFHKDETFLDIQLQGSDGVIVRGNRHLLAARSDVFHKMLLGDYSEASKDTIPIGFAGHILQAVVRYMLTDKTTILKDIPKNATEVGQDDALSSMKNLLQLMDAAAFFNLPKLCELAFDVLSRSLRSTPSFSLFLLEIYSMAGPVAPNIKLMALGYLSCIGADVAKWKGIVQGLSLSVLKSLAEETEHRPEETQLFEIIRVWSEGEDTGDSEAQSPSSSQDRRSAANELMKHIHPELIRAHVLSTTVAESGFFSQEQLLEAYKAQALGLEDQRAAKRARCLPCWDHSGTEFTTVNDMMTGNRMTSGIHRWMLEIVGKDKGTCIWVGIAEPESTDVTRFLWGQENTWGVTSSGKSLIGRTVDDVGFRLATGSRVVFELNLLEGSAERGTMKIGYGTSYRLAPEIVSNLDTTKCYVPAVSFKGSGIGCVRIVEKSVSLRDVY